MRNARHVKVLDLEKGVRGMQIGRRKIFLTPHFIQRWHERIGQDSQGKIKRVLQSTLLEKAALKHREHYFAIDVRGRQAIFAIDVTGAYGFVTLLGREMRVQGVHDEGKVEAV